MASSSSSSVPNNRFEYLNCLESGMKAAREDDLVTAVALFDRGLLLNKKAFGSIQLYINRGAARAKMGLYKEALEDAQVSIEALSSQLTKSLQLKASAEFHLSLFEKAINSTKEALRFEPNNVKLQSMLKAATSRHQRQQSSQTSQQHQQPQPTIASEGNDTEILKGLTRSNAVVDCYHEDSSSIKKRFHFNKNKETDDNSVGTSPPKRASLGPEADVESNGDVDMDKTTCAEDAQQYSTQEMEKTHVKCDSAHSASVDSSKTIALRDDTDPQSEVARYWEQQHEQDEVGNNTLNRSETIPLNRSETIPLNRSETIPLDDEGKPHTDDRIQCNAATPTLYHSDDSTSGHCDPTLAVLHQLMKPAGASPNKSKDSAMAKPTREAIMQMLNDTASSGTFDSSVDAEFVPIVSNWIDITRTFLQNQTVAELQAALKLNGQRSSLPNKAAYVAAVLEYMAKGCLPKCPKCNAYLVCSEDKTRYECMGHWSKEFSCHMPCGWKGGITRAAWLHPPHWPQHKTLQS